jgi:hypothetical protein
VEARREGQANWPPSNNENPPPILSDGLIAAPFAKARKQVRHGIGEVAAEISNNFHDGTPLEYSPRASHFNPRGVRTLSVLLGSDLPKYRKLPKSFGLVLAYPDAKPHPARDSNSGDGHG